MPPSPNNTGANPSQKSMASPGVRHNTNHAMDNAGIYPIIAPAPRIPLVEMLPGIMMARFTAPAGGGADDLAIERRRPLFTWDGDGIHHEEGRHRVSLEGIIRRALEITEEEAGADPGNPLQQQQQHQQHQNQNQEQQQ